MINRFWCWWQRNNLATKLYSFQRKQWKFINMMVIFAVVTDDFCNILDHNISHITIIVALPKIFQCWQCYMYVLWWAPFRQANWSEFSNDLTSPLLPATSASMTDFSGRANLLVRPLRPPHSVFVTDCASFIKAVGATGLKLI